MEIHYLPISSSIFIYFIKLRSFRRNLYKVLLVFYQYYFTILVKSICCAQVDATVTTTNVLSVYKARTVMVAR